MLRYLIPALAAIFPALAQADTVVPGFSDLIVFGDSLSDPGNAFVLSGGTIPDPAIYPEGQFTNGAVWASMLGADLASGTNFAVGGAKAVTDSDPSPDFEAQRLLFEAAAPALGSNPLVAISFGGNDLRAASAPSDIAAAVTAILDGVGDLISDGFANFAVFSLPNLGRLPGIIDPLERILATQATLTFNSALQTGLAAYAALAEITWIDAFDVVEDIATDPAAFGISNVTETCVLGGVVCSDPNSYLYYDFLHPTEGVHALFAQKLIDAYAQPIPLPASVWPLILSLAALGAMKRRNRT